MTRAQIAVSAVVVYHFLFPRQNQGRAVSSLSSTIGVKFDNNYVYAISHADADMRWEYIDHRLDLDIEGTTTNRSKFRVTFKHRTYDTVTLEYRNRVWLEFKNKGDYFEVFDTNSRNEVYEMRADGYHRVEVRTPYNSDYGGDRFYLELY